MLCLSTWFSLVWEIARKKWAPGGRGAYEGRGWGKLSVGPWAGKTH